MLKAVLFEPVVLHNFSDVYFDLSCQPFDNMNFVSRYIWPKGVVGRVTLELVSFLLPWAFVIAVLSVIRQLLC